MMKALEELSKVQPRRATVATIGVFDGVHLGHQHLLKELKRVAAETGSLSVVVTFLNHPRSVLRPEAETSYLCTTERRLELLRSQGVDIVSPITFDLPLSRLRAKEFLALLQERLQLHGLVVGPDFALGHQREGTVPVLQALGRDMGIAVTVVKPLAMADSTVSSTAIRNALATGETVAVARMLGRPFRLEGTVGHGDRRGNTLGFPTANLLVEPTMALPKDGIYATWTCLEDNRYPSATSIGVRPTFGAGLHRTVETFILDFRGNLYERPMALDFAGRLRDELRFESSEALVAQMEQDVAQARTALRDARWMVATSAPQ